ncbi:hypothetical protein I4F81_002351 [Pyropia yezoensis]|uniref:Uncharacterized protein n=1 Tax=Pyropia yezoensis TaxID=2788 RepID=A0ACC3BPE0_PYRYE|nr:hypothetical protein I4F81_002351 [Neopyropia yezoensis]
MGLAIVGGAVVFRAASPSWPVLPRVVGFGGVSREAPLRPQPASLRLLRMASSRDYPLAAPLCAVSCSLDRVQPSSSVPPWYGWVTHSSKYHSSLCSVAQRMRGNENWQEGDPPPDAKVQCALCRDKKRRHRCLAAATAGDGSDGSARPQRRHRSACGAGRQRLRQPVTAAAQEGQPPAAGEEATPAVAAAAHGQRREQRPASSAGSQRQWQPEAVARRGGGSVRGGAAGGRRIGITRAPP